MTRFTNVEDVIVTKHQYPDWTIDVEDFGGISRARVSMAPLVLLVGRNNTGKSYIATLLWSLMNFDPGGFARRQRQGQRQVPTWFTEFCSESSSTVGRRELTLGQKQLQAVSDYITQILQSEKDMRFKDLFSYAGVCPKSLKLTFGANTAGTRLVIERKEVDKSFVASVDASTGGSDIREITYVIGVNVTVEPWLERALFSHLVRRLVSTPGSPSEAIYIPAARTGLMLAYRSLVSSLLDNLGLSHEQEEATLPRPVIQFLRALTSRELSYRRNSKLPKLARELENRVLSGEVKSAKGTIPSFSYLPVGLDEALPLHVTSSMVTELAPFLLLLKAGYGGGGIIFEEPEAHLHLSAQREMARVIARLVNSKIPVVVTTHSDTFVQQINNLINIGGNKKRRALMREYGYSQDEILDRDSVRAFEFVTEHGRTQVKELPSSVEGFAVQTLNDTLVKLAEETLSLQGEGNAG